jgi:hypothetical protein
MLHPEPNCPIRLSALFRRPLALKYSAISKTLPRAEKTIFPLESRASTTMPSTISSSSYPISPIILRCDIVDVLLGDRARGSLYGAVAGTSGHILLKPIILAIRSGKQISL